MEDDAVIVQTAIGTVQIIGSRYDFRSAKERQDRMEELIQKLAVTSNVERKILLLHNPSDYQYVPANAGNLLVLSGHYHGGQLGLISFGLNTTILSLLCWLFQLFNKSEANIRKWTRPDHGVFQFKNDPTNRSRLYSHRGTGKLPFY